MKTSRVFWGVLFLVVGVLLLLDKYEVWSVHWRYAWKFWPLVLVLWGIAVLMGSQKAKLATAFLAAISLGILISAVLSPAWIDHDEGEVAALRDQDFAQAYESSIRQASLSFESGAGTFILKDTTVQLFSASIRSSFGTYKFAHDQSQRVEHLRLELESKRAGWRLGRFENRAVIQLHASPVWDMQFKVGAARMDIDASAYKVERITIDAGAADVRIKMGMRVDEARLSIRSGASTVMILVPEAAACEIRVDAPLSRKNFREFQKIGSGTYRTENFNMALKRISIEVDAGVSSLKVTRY